MIIRETLEVRTSSGRKITLVIASILVLEQGEENKAIIHTSTSMYVLDTPYDYDWMKANLWAPAQRRSPA